MSDADIQSELLPLGSIVKVEGTHRKLMIVGRNLAVSDTDGNQELYDYAMVIYPYGIIGDALVYTNHEYVVEVIFEGYVDEEDAEMMIAIDEATKEAEIAGIPKGNPGPIGDEW